jgi:hypothetical protein
LLDVQQEAVYTYQEWGEKDPDVFLTAIRGNVDALRAKKTDIPIWGWSGIARRIQFDDTRQDAFNEARYNLALCRMKYARSKSGKKQTDLLRQAEQDILMVQRIRPTMGGEKWFARYDELLRKIQKELGTPEAEQGLKAAERKMSAASK